MGKGRLQNISEDRILIKIYHINTCICTPVCKITCKITSIITCYVNIHVKLHFLSPTIFGEQGYLEQWVTYIRFTLKITNRIFFYIFYSTWTKTEKTYFLCQVMDICPHLHLTKIISRACNQATHRKFFKNIYNET